MAAGTITTWFMVARAVHIGACLLAFGLFAFDRLIATSVSAEANSETARYWDSRLRLFSLILLPLIFLSGAAWFVLTAMMMSGEPLQMDVLQTVWSQTQFGTAWKIRLLVWFGATLAALFFRFSKFPFQSRILRWLQFLLTGTLLGSLAWGGHGVEGSSWHLLADILHLLTAGLWPSGLLPLFLLLRHLRRGQNAQHWFLIAALVRRFSAWSLAAVSLLVITGWANSWFLAGPVSNLLKQAYTRFLLVKIGLFLFAFAIGAVNLLRLKPRLVLEKFQSERSEKAIHQIQFNIQAELALSIAVVLIVAILGILPPGGR